MFIDREQHIGATSHQRADSRTAYANGTKPKTLETPAGRVVVDVPKTRSLARPASRAVLSPGPHPPHPGLRRAVVAALAQMYV